MSAILSKHSHCPASVEAREMPDLIPVTTEKQVREILEVAATEQLAEYRYDMLRFRLRLTLRVPDVWKSYVDGWPAVRLVFHCRRVTKSPRDLCEMMYDVLSHDSDTVRMICHMTRQLKTELGLESFYIIDISNDYVDGVVNRLRAWYDVVSPMNVPFVTYILEKCPVLPGSPLPAGFTVSSLDENAAYVKEFGEQQMIISVFDMTYLLQDFIAHLPSAGVFNEDGTLVAYIVTNAYGSLGKLYVLPEYRRRGLAAFLIAHLSNRIVQEGYLNKCLINTYTDNEAAIRCFKTLGYQYINESARWWLNISDKA